MEELGWNYEYRTEYEKVKHIQETSTTRCKVRLTHVRIGHTCWPRARSYNLQYHYMVLRERD